MAILIIFKPPYFLTDFDKTCINVNGLLSTLLQETLTTYVAFSFNYFFRENKACYFM